MSSKTVLVFGVTGQVGGAAAREAAERGCKVWVASRDPSKPISWLSKEKEEDGSFTRVKADLGDPASVTEAVKKSGATAAFVYLPMGISTRPAFQALKDAGVTWVSILSSFTVEGDLTKYAPETVIPYHHAEGELDLQAVGIAYAAVRPGYFASNVSMFFLNDIKSKGELNLYEPDKVKYDWIAPENIGQVAGALLASPKPNLKPTEPEIVYVIGPNFESVGDVVKKVGKALGKDIKVNSISEEEHRKNLASKGIPPPFINYIVNQDKDVVAGSFYESQAPGDHSQTILKYTGKQPITFDQWLESNKADLAS